MLSLIHKYDSDTFITVAESKVLMVLSLYISDPPSCCYSRTL
jgi:hypothetical protein